MTAANDLFVIAGVITRPIKQIKAGAGIAPVLRRAQAVPLGASGQPRVVDAPENCGPTVPSEPQVA